MRSTFSPILVPVQGRLRAVRAASLAALVGLCLAGCESLSALNPFDGSEKYKPEAVAFTPAEQLYNEGLARQRDNDFEGAARKFETLDKQHPRSEWARKAQLMVVYSNYEGGKYDDAVVAAKRYLTLHPQSPDGAYVSYLMANSYYSQIPDVSRDQERAVLALETMTQFLQRYPKTEYTNDIRFKVGVVRDQLAGKEMTVGRYYLERRNYTAAINRFRDVVAKYQTTRHVEEALMRLTESYYALGIASEAQTAAAVLGHNFPDSPWYKDSYTLLQSGGLEPREDTGSWISRAFRGFTRVVVGQ
ncbi:MAG: outer membrane protein assembly factor BamD [Beijerinckiaceae bacterium]